MKIAISGKGGVGKTTLAAFLADMFASEGRAVFAVDADPDANLAESLGFSGAEALALTPIAEMKEIIEERTGSQNLTSAGGRIFTLNPEVSDLPDRFSLQRGNLRVLLMGHAKSGGAGCYCPENVLLKRLLNHLFIHRDEVVIVDMEAGLEHLNRGTSSAVDAFVVVVEPGGRSIKTAHSVLKLAADLHISKVYAIANKVRTEEDRAFIEKELGDIPLLGCVPYTAEIIEADIQGDAVPQASPKVSEAVRKIKEKLKALVEVE